MTTVFLCCETGDDANDGTKDRPIRSLKRAEILFERMPGVLYFKTEGNYPSAKTFRGHVSGISGEPIPIATYTVKECSGFRISTWEKMSTSHRGQYVVNSNGVKRLIAKSNQYHLFVNHYGLDLLPGDSFTIVRPIKLTFDEDSDRAEEES